MAFIKCLFSGIAAILLVWLASVVVVAMHMGTVIKAEVPSGPVAVAGGWEHLLHNPFVVMLLTLAFGIGFYLCARRV